MLLAGLRDNDTSGHAFATFSHFDLFATKITGACDARR
jgi:hypothetical protein